MWNWGPEANRRAYDKKAFHSFEDIDIIVRGLVTGTILHWSVREISDAKIKKDKINISALCYTKLWELVHEGFGLESDDDFSSLAYANPYWGNEVFKISDDVTLHVAISTLRFWGPRSITLFVSYSAITFYCVC